MKEAIYTIPISEVFEPKDGCPLCRLRDILEQRCLEYIMGAAMMEPDIRVETNRLGFCKDHYFMMLKRKNRLSIALMLQSHLDGFSKMWRVLPVRSLPSVPSFPSLLNISMGSSYTKPAMSVIKSKRLSAVW